MNPIKNYFNLSIFKDSACTTQQAHCLSAMKTNPFMLRGEVGLIVVIIIIIIIYCNWVCSNIHTRHINYHCVKDVKFLNVKPDATQSNDYLYSYIELSQLFMDERLVSPPPIQN
jgi:hypothetical protein